MFQFLKKLFGYGTSVNYAELLQNGAVIIDVRTSAEFQSGHIKGSLNLPLDSLGNNLSQLKKDAPIIACCASGMRSAAAINILKSNGFTEVYNAGSWINLQNKIN